MEYRLQIKTIMNIGSRVLYAKWHRIFTYMIVLGSKIWSMYHIIMIMQYTFTELEVWWYYHSSNTIASYYYLKMVLWCVYFCHTLYWLPCRCSPACFVPFTPDGSEFAFTHFPITIESVSLFQSAILTKRSNSLLAVHVLLTQQHAFRFYLPSLTTNWGSKWCIFL